MVKTDDHYWDAKEESVEGPFIVWEYYGYEGWHPTSYPTLEQALSAPRDQSEYAVTKVLDALDKSKKTYVR
jgi:hypothetical protein